MNAHLFTGDTIPPEYLELILCRDVYHCPPQMLPPLSKVLPHLTCIQMEQKAAERKARKSKHGR